MADIVLKDRHGTDVKHPGIRKARLLMDNGEKQVYSEGEAVSDIPIELDFSGGDQVVAAPEGTLIKSAIIVKPEGLKPENIREGVVIGEIEGNLSSPELEEKTVELDFSEGDMTVEPSKGKLLSSVDIPKPANLVPENIAKDIEVAGIMGTHEGGGGGDIDFMDENLSYFTYQINPILKTITLFSIDADALFSATGTYDITIPDKIAGLNVIISI